VQMFLRCQTQWRTGMAGPVGLDYGALDFAFRLYAVQEPATMLEDIQIIEGEILMAAQEKAK